jgi:hypothetical protein
MYYTPEQYVKRIMEDPCCCYISPAKGWMRPCWYFNSCPHYPEGWALHSYTCDIPFELFQELKGEMAPNSNGSKEYKTSKRSLGGFTTCFE